MPLIRMAKLVLLLIALTLLALHSTVSGFSWMDSGPSVSGTSSGVSSGSGQKSSASRVANYNYYKNREIELEEALSAGEEKCLKKPCVQSEQCCPGSVCVDTHPGKSNKRQVTGTCLPIYGANEGVNCLSDDDCEPGMRCLEAAFEFLLAAATSGDGSSGHKDHHQAVGAGGGGVSTKTCQTPEAEMMKKQYNDECSSSSECDASHGLCCQLIKRHRMTPRRACLYFSDPKICLGTVDATFARPMAYSGYSPAGTGSSSSSNGGGVAGSAGASLSVGASSHYFPTERDYFRARIG